MTRVQTFHNEGLGHLSYVVDLGDGTASIVDPPRFPTAHEAAMRAQSLSPLWTIDTHSHADYVTGSPGLAERTGATFLAPGASRLATRHEPLTDGDGVTLAPGVALRAIATPGHTPDHHAYLLEHNGEPTALFTGGSLMVGAVGRTDLNGPALAEPLARAMFRSLKRFDTLDDGLVVHPTHGAGSFCSAPGGSATATTLGRERATNPLLRIDDEDLFVEGLLDGFGTFPPYFRRLPEINRRGPRPYAGMPALEPLDADAVEAHLAGGAVLIDARPIAEFAAGHVPGSLSNALRPQFASWVGWLVELGRPLVFVLGPRQDRAEVVRHCLDVGHEQLVGVLGGGIDAWISSGRPVARIELVGGDAFGSTGTVVDVRQEVEHRAGHVPDSLHVELGSIATAEVPNGSLLLMCGHGERAMTAASALRTRGIHDLRVLAGSPDDWAAWASLPLAVGR